MRQKRAAVPCAGCTLCCQGDAIRLQACDPVSEYQTEPHPFIAGALMIAHKPNGECVYLDERGCSIHDRAPELCRSADCRSIALRFDYETARRLHATKAIDFRVWDHGRTLVEKGQVP